jgi:hypothetical protein
MFSSNLLVVVVVVYYTHIFTWVLDLYIKNIRYVLATIEDYKEYKQQYIYSWQSHKVVVW